MNPGRARELVVLSMIGTGALIVIGEASKGSLPAPRRVLALGLAYVGLAGVTSVAPTLGAALAGTVFAGTLLRQGEAAADAVSGSVSSSAPISGSSRPLAAEVPILGRAAAPAAAPANGSTTGASSDAGGSGRGKAGAVQIAVAQLARTRDYDYEQVRPIPSSLNGKVVTDCSGFVTLVYKTAGLPDPNGRGYDGQGYTGTLWAHGRPTSRPAPGDLVFYGVPALPGGAAHVAIVVSATEAVGFGSDGGPRRHSITYRPVAGFRTYPS